jgi:uncharacterized protein (DUF1800 family)
MAAPRDRRYTVRVSSPVPFYQGKFGKAEAERLLWRAGFGARPGEAEALAKRGLDAAVHALTRPGPMQLVGPDPHDDRGFPLAPADAFGHDHLWWLDRMVRTTTPLVERMVLIWHDWFATSNSGVASQRLMLQQNELFRANALGGFDTLVKAVTTDPAMLIWLSGSQNVKNRPNENYARELMELFTLGADRGAYSETDVREQARALTGWRGNAAQGFRYDEKQHDAGVKTVFGKTGNYDWQAACELCLAHPLHPSYFVTRMWSYFVPTPPSAATVKGLVEVYEGRKIRPVVEAILKHPDLHRGPRMVKPAVVYNAGLLRTINRFVDTAQWWSLDQSAGMRLFYPPDVAGWRNRRPLDTSTFRARWFIAALVQGATQPTDSPADAEQLVARAVGFWGSPTVSDTTRKNLVRFAKESLVRQKPSVVETALRRLVATSPDLQTA